MHVPGCRCLARALRRSAGALAAAGGLLLLAVVTTTRILDAPGLGIDGRLATVGYLLVHGALPVVAGLAVLRDRAVLLTGGVLVALGGFGAVGLVDHVGQMILAGTASASVVLAATADLSVAAAGGAAAGLLRAEGVTLRGLDEARRDAARVGLVLGAVVVAFGMPAWPWQPVGPASTQALETTAWLVAPPGWTRVAVALSIAVVCALALLAALVRPPAPAIAIAAVIVASGTREIVEAVALRRVWEEGMTAEPLVWMVLHVGGLVLVAVSLVSIARDAPSVRSRSTGGETAG